jgi:putative membrane protein
MLLHSSWNLAPGVLAGLTLAGGAYAVGLARLWREAGHGRVVPRWRAAAYAGGVLALALALVSPLDALGETLFWGHMVQHLVLMLVAAPLLVLGAPGAVLLRLPGPAGRRRLGAWWHRRSGLRALAALLTTPLLAWGLHIATVWAWHLPAAYQAALSDERLHALEHLSFLTTALLFWWVVLQPTGRRRLNHGMAVLYVVTAGMLGGMLGALLTFAGRPFYPAQSAAAGAWGLTALEDQQLAGLIMWLPGGLVYLIAAAVLFVRWLRVEEIRSRRLDRVLAAAPPIAGLALVVLLGGCPGRSDTASDPASVDASTHEAKVPMVHDLVGSRGRARGGLLDDIAHASQRAPERSDEAMPGDRASGPDLHIERLWQPRHRQRSTGE